LRARLLGFRRSCQVRMSFPIKFRTNAHLREHLYRKHRVPIQCKRCWINFKSSTELEGHYTADDICEKKAGTTAEGVTADIEERLRSRKQMGPRKSEEDRWREIYKLLFPDEIVPSPCERLLYLLNVFVLPEMIFQSKNIEKFSSNIVSKTLIRFMKSRGSRRMPKNLKTMKNTLAVSFRACTGALSKSPSISTRNHLRSS
jgi:hypothetical protein